MEICLQNAETSYLLTLEGFLTWCQVDKVADNFGTGGGC